jgi:fucose permease
MPALTWAEARRTALRPRLAIAAGFLVHGWLFATWAARIPGIKRTLALSDGELGFALFGVGLGTFLALPLSAWLIARLASGPVAVGAALAACTGLCLAGLAPALWALLPALLLFGAALGTMDVAMNAQAAALEAQRGRALMSSFHALWSLGALAGAAGAAGFAALEWAPRWHFAAAGMAGALAALALRRHWLPQPRSPAAGGALAWPSRPVLFLGAMAACAAVVEGGIADWSGVYLREALGTTPALAAGGYAAFSLAMLAGRLGGDRLIERFTARAVLRAGASLAAVALAVTLWVAHPLVSLAGFLLVGLGICTAFPIAFSLAGRQEGDQPAHAIAAVATMAYGTGLAAPPFIGFVAEVIGLRSALWGLVLCAVAVAVLAGRLPAAAPRN